MRTLHMTHPDQVDDLPMEFASWVLAFAATEKQAEEEAQQRASKS
jgi:hypothetical protein